MEFEKVMTQATLRSVEHLDWDALGQALVLQATLGRVDGPGYSVAVQMTLEAARQLQHLLLEAFSETDTEGPTKQ